MNTQTSNGKEIALGKRVIWWNAIIGLFVAALLYQVTPAYMVFIPLLLVMRIIAILFEYTLFRAMSRVSEFVGIPGIRHWWAVAFLATVAVYSYEVADAAFHYGMGESPYFQIPPNIFQAIEGIGVLFLGFYFGKLPQSYGKLAFYGRFTHILLGFALLLDGGVALSSHYAFLAGITVYFAISVFLLAIFVESKIFTRTLFLINAGAIDKDSLHERKMFERLADFSYVRSKKQAFGFYLVYLLTIFVTFYILGAAVGFAFPEEFSANASLIVVALCSAFAATLLAFLILKGKGLLDRFTSVLYLVAVFIISFSVGNVLALVLVAYLSTKCIADDEHKSLNVDSGIVAPLPVPTYPVSHIKRVELPSLQLLEEKTIPTVKSAPKKIAARKKVSAKISKGKLLTEEKADVQ